MGKRTLITAFAITYRVTYYTFDKERWNKQWEKEIQGRNSDPVETILEPAAPEYALTFSMRKPDGFTIDLKGEHKVKKITERGVNKDSADRDIVVVLQSESDGDTLMKSNKDEDIIIIPPEDEPM
jgi:hypothetical protein